MRWGKQAFTCSVDVAGSPDAQDEASARKPIRSACLEPRARAQGAQNCAPARAGEPPPPAAGKSLQIVGKLYERTDQCLLASTDCTWL